MSNACNPFLTSGFIHPYHLDESIPSLRVSSGCFHFDCIFSRNFCKQTV